MHEIFHEVKPMHTFHVCRALESLALSTWFAVAAALFAIPATPSTASAQVVLSVTIAPPALPVYTQPVCPGDGYIWTPGYWSYSDDGGYFWVPGTWVEAPEVGFLWTPGYWGWSNGAYLWNAGYWGPEVGFYGGINYGFGYVGTGYLGGRWTDGHFFYNSRVNNVDVHVIHNVYQRTVVVHDSHVSFNGGRGGVSARPTAAQERFAHEQHTPPTSVQEQHVTAARSDRSQFASVNHGRPAVVATARPGELKGPGVVQAKASASDRIGTSRTETKSAAKPHSESSTRAESTPRTETKTEAGRQPKSEAAPKPESKPATTREPKTEAKPKAESKPAATHEPKSEAKSKTESKPATTHEPKTEAKTKTESKPAVPREPKTEAKPKTESRPAATRAPETESKPKTESKPAATHEAKAEPKPEAKPQAQPKPAATHESKPPAQHESAPAHEEKPKKN
jgi:WXXGXW repeat (2 copies)